LAQRDDYGYTENQQSDNGQSFAAAQTAMQATILQQQTATAASLESLYNSGEITKSQADAQTAALNTSLAEQQAALNKQQATQTQSDRLSFADGDTGYKASTATANGNPELASQLNFQTQATDE
jgi:hypothetical protein